MNKVLNINLGGYAITIDDDAYEYLAAYLDSIRRRFSESDGRDEILRDIESRLGELISGSMGSRTIVMLPDVEAAVEIMGKPEDFGAEPVDSKKTSSSGKPGGPAIRTGKRLFRDEEDATVGGVCSGLAAYFGMNDPVWMRLIFVLLTFLSAGFWVPAYLLLWILVPPAKTAADRLSMRGEKINVDNIAREVEDGFERISNKVNEYGSKKNADRSLSAAVSSGMSVIGQIFGFVIRFIAKFAVLIGILIGVGLFVALLVSWAGGIFGMITAAPLLDYMSPLSGGLNYLGFANIFFILGLPILGLCLFFVRLLFGVRTPGWATASLAVFWTINLCSGLVLVAMASKDFRQSGTLTRTLDLQDFNSDTLRIEWAGQLSGDDTRDVFGNDVILGNDRLEINDLVNIRVRRGDSNRFECVQNITARGSSNSNALDNATKTEFNIVRDGNVLRVPSYYGIPKGQKWRAQNVRLTITVPEGKYIVFGDRINHRVHDVDYADNDGDYYISDYPNRVFRMTANGLTCADCPAFGDRDYKGGRNFENFILEGDFSTEINKGDNFIFRIEGAPADRELVKVIRTGEKITFTTEGKTTGGRVKIYMEAPVFTSLYANNTGPVVIRGFEEGRASISARGTSQIKAYIDVLQNLELLQIGASQIELTGDGGYLEAKLTEGAVLESSGFRANEVDISAKDGSKARVHAKSTARVKKDSQSEVKVDGDAHVEELGTEN
ncbi:MAG: PspC domain-containing protein [Saprospiraceae bacterium]|nr:PspC domain-containing protein [Saprospiraceae bacterium]